MFDANLLFHNAAAVTTNGDSASLNIKKTPAEGVWVEIAVTAVSGTGTPTFTFRVDESDNDSSYNAVVTFPDITATGRYFRVVQSKKAYLRLNRVVSGTTPSATVTAGIVSGPQIDAVA